MLNKRLFRCLFTLGLFISYPLTALAGGVAYSDLSDRVICWTNGRVVYRHDGTLQSDFGNGKWSLNGEILTMTTPNRYFTLTIERDGNQFHSYRTIVMGIRKDFYGQYCN